jgi:hypothetical protein
VKRTLAAIVLLVALKEVVDLLVALGIPEMIWVVLHHLAILLAVDGQERV